MCGEKHFEEYKAVILLSVILENYREVENAIKCGSLVEMTSEIVIDSLRIKEVKLNAEKQDF